MKFAVKKFRRLGKNSSAFTLVEVLAIITVLALLSTLLLPALTRAKIKSFTAQCLSNKKEIQAGCAMYSNDYNDTLVQNDPVLNTQGWMHANNEDWNVASANTNYAQYISGTLAPYINNNILLYRCPGDLIPSANGIRLRSISMNIQVGEMYNSTSASNLNPRYRVYQKLGDLGNGSLIWNFCDESMFTMNDGCLQIDQTNPDFPDGPAAYHDSGNCLSYLDGHAAFQKWNGSVLRGILYSSGAVRAGGSVVTTTLTDPDWLWFKAHTAELQ